MKPAIVYLAQNNPRDLQYGRDSRSLLEKSLDLLFKNYNDKFKHDVLIFHEGDFKEQDQAEVARGRKEIKFKEIHFDIPAFLPAHEVPKIWTDGYGSKFGMGHRHMIRFYAVRLFDILDEMGYDWFFRMDDDSFLHSKVDYDLFEFMASGGYEYGYRVDFRDAATSARGFGAAVEAYLKAENITPTFFNEHLAIKRLPMKAQLKNLFKGIQSRVIPGGKQYEFEPLVGEYDLWGYYNNFFITKIAFWKRPELQAFIHHFDRLGGWYKYRWNDLIFQSAAVQVFMPKAKVYKFTDWTYEHGTIKQGKLLCGGIYEGTSDANSEVVKKFKATYGVTAAGEPCPSY